jgi:hypothetical protein
MLQSKYFKGLWRLFLVCDTLLLLISAYFSDIVVRASCISFLFTTFSRVSMWRVSLVVLVLIFGEYFISVKVPLLSFYYTFTCLSQTHIFYLSFHCFVISFVNRFRNAAICLCRTRGIPWSNPGISGWTNVTETTVINVIGSRVIFNFNLSLEKLVIGNCLTFTIINFINLIINSVHLFLFSPCLNI